MFGLGRPQTVAENEAEGEVARVYHEIRQVLRVSGVNLIFRKLASYRSFPTLWDAVRPNAESRAFEDGADRIRSEAVRVAEGLGRVGARGRVPLGESQAYQVVKAFELYHYVNPKLLVLTSALGLALDGESDGRPRAEPGLEQVERGVPPRMYPMEMISEETDDGHLRDLFGDIKRTLNLPSVNSDYRTLALWPGYLAVAWEGLKPIVGSDEHRRAGEALGETARSVARALPLAVPLSREKIDELGDDAAEVAEMIATFERLLPSLILNVALIGLDWRSPDDLTRSPFPATPRHRADLRPGDPS